MSITIPTNPAIGEHGIATIAKQSTPEDFLSHSDGRGYEFVDGEWKEMPMGVESGWIAGILYGYLFAFLVERPLGYLFPAEVGYECFPFSPKLVRKPDTSFIRLERIPENRPPKGWITIPPDLAIESLSPDDLASEVDAKVEQYLRVGVRLIWVIQPETRTVLVSRLNGSTERLREQDELDGEDVIPGFRCPVVRIFHLPGLVPQN